MDQRDERRRVGQELMAIQKGTTREAKGWEGEPGEGRVLSQAAA